MNRLITLLLLSFGFGHSASAAVVFSGTVNIVIPLNFDGVYLNPYTGVTTTSHPVDWNTASWINPFFGGVYVANNDLLRPVITGADQVVNLAAGTLINGASNFVAGESGSSTHLGVLLDQFTPGAPSYLGFAFQPTTGGSTYYGWADVTFDNDGPGSINRYAYEDTEAGILAGSIVSIPEPSHALLMLLGLCGVALRRRR